MHRTTVLEGREGYGRAVALDAGSYSCRSRSLVDGFEVGDSTVVLVDGALFSDGFESGGLASWSVAGPIGGTLLLFADDFNDGIFDPAQWTWYGHTVREQGGRLQVDCEVTDQGGGANVRSFRIGHSGLVTVTRQARIGAGNSFFDGSLRFDLGDDESHRFGISYANYQVSTSVECPAHGFALYRFGANSHYCADQGVDVTEFIPGVWDTWFQEGSNGIRRAVRPLITSTASWL